LIHGRAFDIFLHLLRGLRLLLILEPIKIGIVLVIAGIEISNQVFAFGFIEVIGPHPLPVHFDEQCIATTEHVLDDTRRSDLVGFTVRVEDEFRVPLPHVQNAYCTGCHFGSPLLLHTYHNTNPNTNPNTDHR
jgi:hypothetical protein